MSPDWAEGAQAEADRNHELIEELQDGTSRATQDALARSLYRETVFADCGVRRAVQEEGGRRERGSTLRRFSPARV